MAHPRPSPPPEDQHQRFTLFPSLPAELRWCIWAEAFPPGVVSARWDPLAARDGMTLRRFEDPRRGRVVLACREARGVWLRRHRWMRVETGPGRGRGARALWGREAAAGPGAARADPSRDCFLLASRTGRAGLEHGLEECIGALAAAGVRPRRVAFVPRTAPLVATLLQLARLRPETVLAVRAVRAVRAGEGPWWDAPDPTGARGYQADAPVLADRRFLAQLGRVADGTERGEERAQPDFMWRLLAVGLELEEHKASPGPPGPAGGVEEARQAARAALVRLAREHYGIRPGPGPGSGPGPRPRPRLVCLDQRFGDGCRWGGGCEDEDLGCFYRAF